MTVAPEIHADLITPLGAYFRLRAGERAGFLLESVEKGRLGRHSLLGTGSRIVTFEGFLLRSAGGTAAAAGCSTRRIR